MRCSLLFVTPYDVDTRLVNLATGRYGYGHVSIWAGHLSQDEPIVLDSGIGYGVGFRPLSIATGRAPFHEIQLDETLSSWIWRRALARIGCEYDYAGLVRSRRPTECYTCSGLVACCLPEHIREALPERVSPNDLAKHFGAPKWK